MDMAITGVRTIPASRLKDLADCKGCLRKSWWQGSCHVIDKFSREAIYIILNHLRDYKTLIGKSCLLLPKAPSNNLLAVRN
jgi:hypothetical protein